MIILSVLLLGGRRNEPKKANCLSKARWKMWIIMTIRVCLKLGLNIPICSFSLEFLSTPDTPFNPPLAEGYHRYKCNNTLYILIFKSSCRK